MSTPGTPNAAPRINRRDNFRFNAFQIVPHFLRGMFAIRPGWSRLLDRRHPDPRGIRLVRELRRRYGSDYLWLKVLGKPTLLVLDPEGIRHVLDAPPWAYGPPDLKVRGMSHFQPDAVTVSSGDDWTRRRAFNAEVLATGESIHPSAFGFLKVVQAAVASMTSTDGATVAWTGIHLAFRRITAGVVFGPGVEAESVLDRLDALMKRANRVAGRSDTAERRAFHDEIRERISDPEAGSLAAAACPHLEPDDPLPVAGQIPHWLFAMKDTLAANCTNALALIAAHPHVQEQARAEVATTDLSDPAAVDGMAYVEGCLRDAMRLWPTTPVIVRKALKDDALAGHIVPSGSQVMIHNGFNHRNPDAMTDPDAFHPEAWQQGVWDYRFNPMSNGPQACAGRELVLLLGKAVLGRFLEGHRWRLSHPSLDPARPIAHTFEPDAVVLTGISG